MNAWTTALKDLSSGARSRVSVLHFGDSHLQSGQMDSVLRQALQVRWGDAGRGFVFPYEATFTSNPEDLASVSDVEWRLRRMMGDGSGGGPVGAGGLGAIAQSVPFVLAMAERHGQTPTAGFDRVRVFYHPGPDRAELWVATREDAGAAEAALRRGAWRERRVVKGDTLSGIALAEGVSVADLRRWNGPKLKLKAGQALRLRREGDEARSRLAGYTVWGVLKGDDPSATRGIVVNLGAPVQQVFILGAQASPNETQAEVQGIVFERSNAPGLIWHTLAANGAQAKHFSQAADLPQQISALAPDLIIVSFGTNETQQSDYRQDAAIAENRRFWRLLRQVAPQASLLICSPPDAAKGRHSSNAHLDGFVQALRAAALEDGAAFIDLRAAQGGDDAYNRWREAGLAGKDGVHYRYNGYRLMGQWLLDALQAWRRPMSLSLSWAGFWPQPAQPAALHPGQLRRALRPLLQPVPVPARLALRPHALRHRLLALLLLLQQRRLCGPVALHGGLGP